jgi:hypothetical protein
LDGEQEFRVLHKEIPGDSGLGSRYKLAEGLKPHSLEAYSYLAGSHPFVVEEYEVFATMLQEDEIDDRIKDTSEKNCALPVEKNGGDLKLENEKIIDKQKMEDDKKKITEEIDKKMLEEERTFFHTEKRSEEKKAMEERKQIKVEGGSMMKERMKSMEDEKVKKILDKRQITMESGRLGSGEIVEKSQKNLIGGNMTIEDIRKIEKRQSNVGNIETTEKKQTPEGRMELGEEGPPCKREEWDGKKIERKWWKWGKK